MTSLRPNALLVLLLGLSAAAARAQVRVNPTGVNVNAQGPTTVFLTFGGLRDGQVAVEAFWCGELIPAAPHRGLRCDPATVFGRLPLRYDRSTRSGAGGFTDIMSIPPSVARRAYQAAAAGSTSSFFYVRRFASAGGGPDEFVAVTCRLAGGGARVPFALLDVALRFEIETPVLHLRLGETPPPLAAEIAYNGTGRLKGRWEVVLPGEDLPEPRDLLTEATLPLEERGTQRRYTQIERFNVFLTPTGRHTLRGPDPARLPRDVEGSYLLMLRVEVSDDKEGDSSLGAVGAGAGVVHSGAVAGFPLPTLRYVVGGGGSELAAANSAGTLELRLPAQGADAGVGAAVEFHWIDRFEAPLYRLEIATPSGELAHSAWLPRGTGSYRAPPWITGAAGAVLQWRVVATDEAGAEIRSSAWRRLRVGTAGGG